MKSLFVSGLIALAVGGCASGPPTRAEISGLPLLDSAWSRVYVSAGVNKAGFKLWNVGQVGPVFINGQNVGSTAKDEHFVVDVPPGSYEAYCHPEQPDKNLPEKRQFTFKAGETRYLACNMEHGAGVAFGLIGTLASDYLSKSFLVDRPLDSNSKLVSYRKAQW